MLVLTRRPNQSIMIGDDIVVTVLEVKGDQIRLGISAPRSVQVFREEVLVALQEANRSAVFEGAADAPAPPAAPEPPTGRNQPPAQKAPAEPTPGRGSRPVPQPPASRPRSHRSVA